jgi:hypothetical protein
VPLSTRLERTIFDALLGAESPRPRWWFYPLIILLAGAFYGGILGSWSAGGEGRTLLIPYAAIKLPLVVLATTCVCLPGYFVLSTVLGLRSDFPIALSAIAAGQASIALALASLAPLTRMAYLSGLGHAQALVLAAMMFTLSTAAGAAVMLRRYRPLFAKTNRHRLMLAAWVTMYIFVGIQMGWMLRPFVGTPGIPVTFVREEPLSNAYVAVAKIIVESVRELGDKNGKGTRNSERGTRSEDGASQYSR